MIIATDIEKKKFKSLSSVSVCQEKNKPMIITGFGSENQRIDLIFVVGAFMWVPWMMNDVSVYERTTNEKK